MKSGLKFVESVNILFSCRLSQKEYFSVSALYS
ncbi:hypothetical protein SAMN05444342_3654 [Haladaptatus paucihalophilus DX253]|uniref:Uncharacterized protein n=1 Tax=Haladaptatus paucihalophilus DX253 TaxID=797209 RepID=A0A1M7A0Z5_HALPU|nr:hypothetical protein SAMN05444342_3654 [Haladaptatus paucihalophilus DX253]